MTSPLPITALHELNSDQMNILKIKDGYVYGRNGGDHFRAKVDYNTRIVSIEYRAPPHYYVLFHMKVTDNTCLYMGDYTNLDGFKAFMTAAVIHMKIFGDVLNKKMEKSYFPEVALGF